MKRKGIILAGGNGTRLFPLTKTISKQLLAVYDKPMIFYPISLLLSIGIRDIAIITKSSDEKQFKQLLGDGSQWGCSLTYLTQSSPDGIAQAYLIAEDFLQNMPSALVLGDNIFYGDNLSKRIFHLSDSLAANTIFGYHVSEPSRYGVVDFNKAGQAQKITEKPNKPTSNYAVTGLYLLGHEAPEIAKSLKPSDRGEFEITDILNVFLSQNKLNVEILDKGTEWLDTGTYASLLEASNFVKTIQERKGLLIGSPDFVSYEMSLVDRAITQKRIEQMPNCDYKRFLLRTL